MITGIILVSLAAFFKAVSDTLIHHFDSSIFPNTRFWNIYLSNKQPRFIKFTKYKWDGWHVANSLMIVCFCLSAVHGSQIVNWWVTLIIYGGIFNLVFNIAYNKVLR